MDKPQTFRSSTALVIWVVWLLFAVGNWIDLAVQGRDHASATAAAVLLVATGIAYVLAQRPRIVADDAGLTIRNPLRDHRVGWVCVAKIDLVDLLRVHCDAGPDDAGLGHAGPGDAGLGHAGPGDAGLGHAGPGDAGLGHASGDPPSGVPGGKQPKVISSWAVHYSRRRQLAAEARARRATTPRRPVLGFPVVYRGPSSDRSPSSRPTPSYAARGMPAAEAEAEKIVRILSERATAARAEAVWAAADTAEPTPPRPASTTQSGPSQAATTQATTTTPAPGRAEPLTSAWSGRAIAALVIPALIVLIVWLL